MTGEWEGPSDSTPIGWNRWASSWPELAGEGERRLLLSYLEDRFGIPQSVFRDYLFFKRKKRWLILRGSTFVDNAHQLKVSSIGLKAFQRVGRYIKPSTRLIQVFGHLATRGCININQHEFQATVAGNTFPSDLALENGYVIISCQGSILGLGLLIDGNIHSQISRKVIRKIR